MADNGAVIGFTQRCRFRTRAQSNWSNLPLSAHARRIKKRWKSIPSGGTRRLKYNVPGTTSAFCRCMAGRSNKKPSWLRYRHYISMQQHIRTYLKQHSRNIFFYPTRQCKLLFNYILVFIFHGLYTCFHHCPSCGGYGTMNIRAPSHLPTISIMPLSVPVGPTCKAESAMPGIEVNGARDGHGWPGDSAQ